jgi:type II secretory pathway pseudopilin PulG
MLEAHGGITMIAYGVGLLIVGLIAGAITGVLVYYIDRALSRYQERHRHSA